MCQFTVAKTPIEPGRAQGWYVEIDGAVQREYSSQWAAIVGAFVAAHDATHGGKEATIVMETSEKQVWTFSLMPNAAESFAPASPR
jgi:hypothetical protein